MQKQHFVAEKVHFLPDIRVVKAGSSPGFIPPKTLRKESNPRKSPAFAGCALCLYDLHLRRNRFRETRAEMDLRRLRIIDQWEADGGLGEDQFNGGERIARVRGRAPRRNAWLAWPGYRGFPVSLPFHSSLQDQTSPFTARCRYFAEFGRRRLAAFVTGESPCAR